MAVSVQLHTKQIFHIAVQCVNGKQNDVDTDILIQKTAHMV